MSSPAVNANELLAAFQNPAQRIEQHLNFSYDFKYYRWEHPLAALTVEAKKKQVAKIEAEINAAMNQDTGCYPYWFADSEGITLMVAIPNARMKAAAEINKPIIRDGLKLLTEAESIKEAQAWAPMDKETAQKIMTRLNEQGFVLCKWQDVPQK